MLRCYYVANLQLTDSTYNIVDDNITIALEPTLGVVNACLPILQPVASNVARSSIFSWVRALISIFFPMSGVKQSPISPNHIKRYWLKERVGEAPQLSGNRHPLSAMSHNHVLITTNITVTSDSNDNEV